MAVGVRTKGMTANELMAHISDLETQIVGLELHIKDMMGILAAIAFLQEDKMFDVSVSQIAAMPPGSSVDFAFNKKLDQYEFTYVPPPPEPSAGLILPISASAEKVVEELHSTIKGE